MSRLPIILATVALIVLGVGWWWVERLKNAVEPETTQAEEIDVSKIPDVKPAPGKDADIQPGTATAGTPDSEEKPAPKPDPAPAGPKPDPKPAGPEPEPVATKDAPAQKEPIYTKGRKTFDGTGKYYMGREIAFVMGHQAIRWLERSNREEEEAPSKAIAALNLKPTDVIADIGAGSGYYTFRLAPLVPKGKVVAVDIQPEMIAFLENKEKELGLTNVEAHLGEVDDTKLKPNSIDAALMVDAYHEFSHPREMMQSLFKALKPGGRIILLEYRAEDPQVPIKPLHKMTEAQSRREMEVVGLKWKSTDSKLLPWQHFMVFVKP